ncbi:peptidylprolyl isomerase [Actinoplanes sp. NPDC049681]|uniref:peptidylprolyl isomerase n=1 Tax=Actinoplanes sp. NPDC049681 TaxID=3363905 RepID=UPI0037B7B520
MSSIKDRQRAAARARLEKEMAERAAAAKKRRQRQAVIGSALAVVVIAGAAVWIVAALGNDDDKKTPAAAPPPPPGTVACNWIPEDGSSGAKIKDTGGLPPANVPNTGKSTLTMDTNLGAITATVDLAKAPCTGAAFTYLAGKKFWDNTKCHRLTTEGIKVLQCGDPSASGKGYRDTDGQGGPNFKYPEENLPTNAKPAYPKGTIAMAKTQAPSTTGSQFFIVYEDTDLPADYTVLGTITKGLDIVESVAKAGSDNANGKGDGHPKKEVDIKTLTMSAA